MSTCVSKWAFYFGIATMILSTSSCRKRSNGNSYSKGMAVGHGCVGELESTMDRMGFRVGDAGSEAGAVITCVEPFLGLHRQYGLQKGDIIVGLNHQTPVHSASDYAEKVKDLATDINEPISTWEFVILRDGKRLTLHAPADWVGCGTDDFSHCGNVAQRSSSL